MSRFARSYKNFAKNWKIRRVEVNLSKRVMTRPAIFAKIAIIVKSARNWKICGVDQFQITRASCFEVMQIFDVKSICVFHWFY